jgi:general L-amino acid transport system permease protein
MNTTDLEYVAPAEAPSERRPPVMARGAIGWLRENLFSSPLNALLTVITAGLLIWFVAGALAWAVRDAEWTVITTNLRLLMIGQYDPAHIWRVSLVVLVVLFLCGASVVLAAGASRPIMITLTVVVIVLLITPMSTTGLTPPPIRYLVTKDAYVGAFAFTGDAGQTVSATVEPLDDNLLAGDIDRFAGYIEATPGLQNSRTLWSDQRAQVVAGTRDLSQYELAFTISLVDSRGSTLAQVTSTPASRAVSLETTLPEDGWYAVVTTLPEGASEQGAAFVRLEGVRTFTTDAEAVREATARYGTPPDFPCPSSADCRRYAAARDLRFDGPRSLEAYLGTQLGPFLRSIVLPVLAGIGVAVAGGLLGALSRRGPETRKTLLRILITAWGLTLIGSWFALRGFEGSALMPVVSTAVWGGLLLTMVLTVVAVLASLPLGVLLALGRTSSLPILSSVCTLFIETIRGVPFITILFFAKLIVPFFISASADVDQAIRMMIGLTIFTAAYLAEVVRGGLQIIPKGQIEAAKALGLNTFQQTTQIVLPQALRAVIPGIMNQFVSLFKDTSLVAVVGLFELLGIIDFIVNGQQQFRGLTREAYLFVGSIYFVIAYAMSSASRWVERTGVGVDKR